MQGSPVGGFGVPQALCSRASRFVEVVALRLLEVTLCLIYLWGGGDCRSQSSRGLCRRRRAMRARRVPSSLATGSWYLIVLRSSRCSRTGRKAHGEIGPGKSAQEEEGERRRGRKEMEAWL
ncbi:hypothetical protein GQ53DRAFT_440231 [Thozetella sp. PMI_491]|nr:hypothetical protein GQ53DRAFT_440231 [Thozetella sp. PMI_491]